MRKLGTSRLNRASSVGTACSTVTPSRASASGSPSGSVVSILGATQSEAPTR